MRLLKNNLLLALLLIAVSLKSLAWWATIPAWHTPDEQAHFAQLQYYIEAGEKGAYRVNPDRNLSRELYVVETVLGVFRDPLGNNKFTYHPEYNLRYTDSFVGEYEPALNRLSRESREEFVSREAAMYPPLYYFLSIPFYLLTYSLGIFDRLFSARILSVLLQLLLSLTAYKIGLLLTKDRLKASVLTLMVSLQPMIAFTAAGYHPDNLLNLLYSLLLLILLQCLKNGLKLSHILLAGLVFYLGWQTKLFMVFSLPLIGAVFSFSLFRRFSFLAFSLPVLILLSPVLIFVLTLPIDYVPQVTPTSPLVALSFFEYLKFRLPKLLYEIHPWYWGVFRWLSLTLPIEIYRLINRLLIVIVFGLLIRLVYSLRNKFSDFESKAILLFLLSIVTYGLYFFLLDWRNMQFSGFSIGLQGRYFLPNIIPQMALILIGWQAFWAVLGKLLKRESFVSSLALVVLVALFLALNLSAFLVVVGSYYDLSSLTTFLIQASQYKPGVLKSLNMLVILAGFSLSLGLSFAVVLKLARPKLRLLLKK